MKSARANLQRRAQRVRRRLKKHSAGRARLSVYRSSKNISVQIIDDATGTTLASASTMEDKKAKGSNVEAAKRIGKLIAERAAKKTVKGGRNMSFAANACCFGMPRCSRRCW